MVAVALDGVEHTSQPGVVLSELLLTAVKVRIIGDTGAYASVGQKVLERAAGHACGPYRVPAVDIRADAVRTNKFTGTAASIDQGQEQAG